MKRIILILLITSVMSFGFELGVILGEPTGISGRFFMGTSKAFDLHAGWSFKENKYDNDSNLDIHGAYLFNKKTDIRIEGYRLPFYFGPGGRIRIGGEKLLLGFKVPLGLYYKFKTAPFSAFIEIAPGMNLIPDADFEVSGGIGIRYIFGTSEPSSQSENSNTERERR